MLRKLDVSQERWQNGVKLMYKKARRPIMDYAEYKKKQYGTPRPNNNGGADVQTKIYWKLNDIANSLAILALKDSEEYSALVEVIKKDHANNIRKKYGSGNVGSTYGAATEWKKEDLL